MPSTSPTSAPKFAVRLEQARWEFALPDGARRLIASGDFGGRDNDTLVRWLASDSVVSERLLRWCNTPLYNLSRPFSNLAEAAAVMDGADLARLAVLASVRNLFLPHRQIDVYCRESLWRHSIAVGAVSSLIARTCGCCDPSLAFVAGTLHDIGLCASERLDGDSFLAVVSEIDELTPTCNVEREILGWDHAQFGAAILEHWGMPTEIRNAARFHHDAASAKGEEIVACVAVANYLCSRSGWASVGAHNVRAPEDATFRCLGINANLLKVLWQQLYPSLESVAELN